ncbi:MAG: hypothetical protein J0I76_10125 [Thiobacillus sp.]|nr:hypothetical protein [Thiobacillus sp.]
MRHSNLLRGLESLGDERYPSRTGSRAGGKWLPARVQVNLDGGAATAMLYKPDGAI